MILCGGVAFWYDVLSGILRVFMPTTIKMLDMWKFELWFVCCCVLFCL